jgi:hypothetical protein
VAYRICVPHYISYAVITSADYSSELDFSHRNFVYVILIKCLKLKLSVKNIIFSRLFASEITQRTRIKFGVWLYCNSCHAELMYVRIDPL